jgi:hypothetical protein
VSESSYYSNTQKEYLRQYMGIRNKQHIERYVESYIKVTFRRIYGNQNIQRVAGVQWVI